MPLGPRRRAVQVQRWFRLGSALSSTRQGHGDRGWTGAPRHHPPGLLSPAVPLVPWSITSLPLRCDPQRCLLHAAPEAFVVVCLKP